MSKVVILVDRAMDLDPTFPPALKKLYKEALQPVLDEFPCKVFKVPASYILENCFLHAQPIMTGKNKAEIQECKDNIVKEFYQSISGKPWVGYYPDEKKKLEATVVNEGEGVASSLVVEPGTIGIVEAVGAAVSMGASISSMSSSSESSQITDFAIPPHPSDLSEEDLLRELEAAQGYFVPEEEIPDSHPSDSDLIMETGGAENAEEEGEDPWTEVDYDPDYDEDDQERY